MEVDDQDVESVMSNLLVNSDAEEYVEVKPVSSIHGAQGSIQSIAL